MQVAIDHFKNWKIANLIGRGSFGAVYRVETVIGGIPREAALKVTKVPTENHSEARIKVIEEVQRLFALSACPNLVRYLDYEIHDTDTGIIVSLLMELMTPLSTVFKTKSRIKEQHIIQLGIDLCDAITSLEQHDIIHGDIKPSNILVNSFGQFALSDLDHLLQSSQKIVGFIGTMNYLAPERYHKCPFTTNADIYSLGIVLYSFLAGNLPFVPVGSNRKYAEISNAVRRRLAGEVPELRISNKRLADAVLKAIQPDPSNRYQHAYELKLDLASSMEESGERDYPLFPVLSRRPDVDRTDVFTILDLTGTTAVQSKDSANAKSPTQERKGRIALPDLFELPPKKLASVLETSIFILQQYAEAGDSEARKGLERINMIAAPDEEQERNEFRKDIFDACVMLLNNSIYRSDSSEDTMNDYVRDILLAKGYIVQDQTRQGTSSFGKQAGEIDLKICKDGKNMALLEALKLSSLNQHVLEIHVRKLLISYDPVGMQQHELLIYYTGKSFDPFVGKLSRWFLEYENELTDFSDFQPEVQLAGIRRFRMKVRRAGIESKLSISILNIGQK